MAVLTHEMVLEGVGKKYARTPKNLTVPCSFLIMPKDEPDGAEKSADQPFETFGSTATK